MTEDEANLTRCCGPEGCGGNSAGEPERYCIASRCMAWRLNGKISDGMFMRRMSEGWYEGTAGGVIDGFCGLAGAPQ